MSRRSGPKGETQFTPTPIDRRGLGRIAKENFLEAGGGIDSVASCATPFESMLQLAPVL